MSIRQMPVFCNRMKEPVAYCAETVLAVHTCAIILLPSPGNSALAT
jgi:hypothetical protein